MRGDSPRPIPLPETAQKWILLFTGFHYLDDLLAFVLSISQSLSPDQGRVEEVERRAGRPCLLAARPRAPGGGEWGRREGCLLCPQLFVVELIPDGAMKAQRLEKY